MARRKNKRVSEAAAAPGERASHCRRLVRRQALKAAGVSALPVPGVDLFVSAHLLVQTMDAISAAYGLSPSQIAALPPAQRTQGDKLARRVGSYLIGRVATEAALIAGLRAVGLRVGAQQAAKLAPVVGLAISGALSGWLFMRVCEHHIEHCEAVSAE